MVQRLSSDSSKAESHQGREFRGSLDLIALKLLSTGDAYGVEMLSKLQAKTSGVLEISDNTLYPLLHRFERAGWVRSYSDTQQGRGNHRRFYTLTDTGRTELEKLTNEWRAFSRAMDQLLEDKENQ